MRSAGQSISSGAGTLPLTVIVRDLGTVAYDEALELQRSLASQKREGIAEDDVLLLLEHLPVITHGRAASDVHIVEDAAVLDREGVQRVEIERGGDVTYHGPGQLVGYPILDLHRYRLDLHWYLRRLEEVIIRSIGSFGLASARAEGLTGVWVGEGVADVDVGAEQSIRNETATAMVRAGSIRKIASIGIHASRWITTHGFALNRTDEALTGFRWIVPCGIDGVTVTSLESEGYSPTRDALRHRVIEAFGAVFDVDVAVPGS